MNKETPHRQKYTNIIIYTTLATLGMFAIFMVFKSTALSGPGVSSDALHYISTAENLAKGNGYYSYNGKPYTHWPPLFPSLLAILRLFKFEPLDGAKIINAISFALVIFCSGLIFAKRIKSPLIIIIGSASVLISATMLRISVYAWTEPLFALLVILFMFSIVRFLKSYHLKSLVLASVYAALGFLQRYVGLAIVIAGLFSILLLTPQAKWRQKLNYATIFGAISCIPLGLWFLRNKFIASTAADYHLWLDTSLLKEITKTLNSLTPWFVTKNIPLVWRLIIIGALISFLVVAVILKNRKFGKEKLGDTMLVKASLVLIAVYAVFTTIASVYVNADADYRIYSSVYLFIILLFLVGFESVGKLSGAILKKEWLGYLAVSVFCGLWLVLYPLPMVMQQIAHYQKYGVPGYNSIAWQMSPLVNWVKTHPLDGQIFSNEPHPLVLLAGVNANITPNKQFGFENFKHRISTSKKNYLIWYYNHWRNHLYNFKELNAQFKLKPIAKLPDGVVFEIQ
ncbi:MAG: hypothetical protein AMJ43_06655 [Coxiella sp. DG_40]|nr:MAG: hypothetical protein AMJ43_06655 [Coxiella sp. DG_40]